MFQFGGFQAWIFFFFNIHLTVKNANRLQYDLPGWTVQDLLHQTFEILSLEGFCNGAKADYSVACFRGENEAKPTHSVRTGSGISLHVKKQFVYKNTKSRVSWRMKGHKYRSNSGVLCSVASLYCAPWHAQVTWICRCHVISISPVNESYIIFGRQYFWTWLQCSVLVTRTVCRYSCV